MIGSIALSIILEQFGMSPSVNAIFETNIDLIFWIMLFIQLLGEELFKVSVFLILMHLIFKIASRKLSVILSTIITLTIFGLLHYTAYSGAIVHIILVIGWGEIFYFYAYLKTKNVVVSYITHLLVDGIVFLSSMLVNF